jgi:metallo-beta-lactamase family protein
MISHSVAQAAVPSVTFWGAAQAVSGSMHLVEVGPHRILLDCGLIQGRREESRRRNSRFPFHPHQIDAVVLTHAHVDHCGNIPTLVRQGFSGPVYCTPATRDLLAVMLADSAKIQEEDAAHLNIQRQYAEPWVQPLYTHPDVERAVSQCVAVPYGRPFEVTRSARVRFHDAGHILGSAMVELTAAANGRDYSLTYTGDLGRRGLPFLRGPDPIPPADLLVCESTYGGRVHEPVDRTAEKLYEAVARTIERGGKALVPAFSLGRTQLVVHFLRDGVQSGKLPAVPVYVDSPLASDIAQVYRRHLDCLSDETARRLGDDGDFLGGGVVHYVRDFEESMRLSTQPGPCVLVAASGMCEGGRIVHHLKHNVDDPRNSVILVSYQAPGTVGRKLLEKKPTIRFMGRDWNKWADVVHLDGFSGHADRDDFAALLAPLADRVGRARLIHGEREQSEALAGALRGLGFADVAVPAGGEAVPLG